MRVRGVSACEESLAKKAMKIPGLPDAGSLTNAGRQTAYAPLSELLVHFYDADHARSLNDSAANTIFFADPPIDRANS